MLVVVTLADAFPELASVAPLHDEVNTRVILIDIKQVGHVEAVAHVHVNVNFMLHSTHEMALQELSSELFVDGLDRKDFLCPAGQATAIIGHDAVYRSVCIESTVTGAEEVRRNLECGPDSNAPRIMSSLACHVRPRHGGVSIHTSVEI